MMKNRLRVNLTLADLEQLAGVNRRFPMKILRVTDQKPPHNASLTEAPTTPRLPLASTDADTVFVLRTLWLPC